METHRLDLQVSEVGSHTAVSATTKANERELRSLVLVAWGQEPFVVERVGVFEQLLRAVLHAGGCTADVTLWDVELTPLGICIQLSFFQCTPPSIKAQDRTSQS